MLVVISPAKKITFSKRLFDKFSTPTFQENANKLVIQLQRLSQNELQKLLHISNDLAKLNYHRYLNWEATPSALQCKQAILTFQGMVFIGIDAETLSDKDLLNSQNNLRILSGLYGVLRPLDLIQPYRLEMGTKWHSAHFKNLYDYWGNAITKELNKTISEQGHQTLINLASTEYFKSVQQKHLTCPVVTPIFKDNRGNGYKVMAVYAKKARGLMTRFIIQNQITDVADIQSFNEEGYYYNTNLSTEEMPTFTREH